eukprot:CAMPEP_0194527988 /NCGR_PEP_ID=MMETSP0253-20130528/64276_1 /TAXON_ID=2966 /ORGANISM="Noctiluca scintillans" /LENGTH=42 /DNA_ID= /DNA_START= /DNA_END= /DNA_ORIENTATION=
MKEAFRWVELLMECPFPFLQGDDGRDQLGSVVVHAAALTPPG